MTTPLYRDDAYLETCNAAVTEVTERGGIVLDQTVFYPTGGGQPGDTGSLMHADGRLLEIATTVTDRDTGNIVHVPGQAEPIPAFGDVIVCQLDVARRRAHMRTHTAIFDEVDFVGDDQEVTIWDRQDALWTDSGREELLKYWLHRVRDIVDAHNRRTLCPDEHHRRAVKGAEFNRFRLHPFVARTALRVVTNLDDCAL